MEVTTSHVFREGNGVADTLANFIVVHSLKAEFDDKLSRKSFFSFPKFGTSFIFVVNL